MKNILLVEDEFLIAEDNKVFLEKHGFTVYIAHNKKNAFDLLKKHIIDLILMDICIDNKTNGIDLAEEILKKEEIPIIFLSSHKEKEVINKAKQTSEYGYVFKEGNKHNLLEVIQIALKLFNSKKKIKEDEKYRENFYENIPIGIFTTTTSGEIYYANKQFLDWFGYTLEEFKNINLEKDFYVKAENRKEFIKSLKSHGSVENFPIQAKTKHGRMGSYLITAELSDNEMINGFLTNITKEKVNEIKYKNLFENSYLGILLLNSSSYKIKECNKKAEKLFLMKMGEMVGKKPYYLSPRLQPNGESSKEKGEEYLKQLVANKNTVEFEWVHKDKKGHTFPAQVELKKNNGTIIATIFDMTKIKAHQKTIEASRDEAIVEKNEHKILLGEIHHRVKNDINTIKSLLELQKLDGEDSWCVDKAISRLNIVSDLYDEIYTQNDIERLNLKNFLEKMINNIKIIFNENISINYTISDASIAIRHIRTIGVIINELIINSYKHAFDGRGEINFEIKIDNGVYINYKDNGRGFDEISGGMGWQLINTMINQYEGHVESSGENGAEFKIFFKM